MISLETIRAAAGRIAGAVERTPCLPSQTLSRLTGCELHLKFENLQFTASFKERGALNKLLSLSDAERRRGVIATVARALNPKIRIYGVESRTYPSMHQRLAGEPVKVGGDTIAEGIAVKDVGDIAFDIVRREVEDVVVVAEETIERAIVALIEIEKTVAEGAGAAALAALREHPQRYVGKRVGIPISGGNIDSRVLASVLMRGLVRDARLVRLRVTMPDVSGSLAKVTQMIADAGGNIVEVLHQRIFGTASVRSPEVELLVETRDREHTQALVRSLEAKGISVSVF